MPSSDYIYLVNQPEISELLMRALVLKGDLPDRLLSSYYPTMQAEDFTAPEFMPLRRWRRFNRFVTAPAVAAQFSFAYLGTAAGSRATLCVIEGVSVTNSSAGATTFLLGIEGDGLLLPGPSTGGATVTDDRINPTIGGAVGTFGLDASANAASPISDGYRFNLAASESRFLPLPTYILTGKPINSTTRSLFYVACTVVNTALNATVWWRERPLLDTET